MDLTNKINIVGNNTAYKANTLINFTSQPRETNAFWIAPTYAYHNGFTFEFTYKKHTEIPLDCLNKPTLPSYCFRDGFAVVLQGSGNKALGYGESGLGYESLMNVLSIEFDFIFNERKFDPKEGYHISIHKYKKRTATAEETYSIAQCPFKTGVFTSYLFHINCKIIDGPFLA